jgi:YegS/Rv2252/BmrU family lipid kinase
MTTIAVVAHQKKQLGGGLGELRRVLRMRGHAEPLWYEARSTKQIPDLVREAMAAGAETIFIWGGDGSVQRGVDVVAGSEVDLAILPAGTANLLARNLGIPIDLTAAVDIGLGGDRRRLDVGVLNDERFAVMAGVGYDALVMREADDTLKRHLGQLAYVVSGTRATKMKSRKVRVTVDDKLWFEGRATCVLLGQMSAFAGGIRVFPRSRPDDGLLDVGVVTAETPLQWARVLSRLVVGRAAGSPFTQMTQGRLIDIKLSRRMAYEVDGGARKETKRLHASVEPGALLVRVPRPKSPGGFARPV